MSWFIVSCSCEECGHHTSLVGPFKTRELAEEIMRRYGGSDEIWQGTCQNDKVVEVTSPKELVKQLQRDLKKEN